MRPSKALRAFVVTALLLTLSPAAMAAQGIVSSVNRSMQHGGIIRDDDASGDTYQFQIPKDLLDQGYQPFVGDRVEFTIDREPSRVARNVVKIAPPNPEPLPGAAPFAALALLGVVGSVGALRRRRRDPSP